MVFIEAQPLRVCIITRFGSQAINLLFFPFSLFRDQRRQVSVSRLPTDSATGLPATQILSPAASPRPRRRRALLAGAAVALLGVAVYVLWPRAAGPAIPDSRPVPQAAEKAPPPAKPAAPVQFVTPPASVPEGYREAAPIAGGVGNRMHMNCVGYGPDGKRFVSDSRDTAVKLWDALTGREIATLEGHKAPVYDVACSADGKYLASASGDGTVRLWDGKTGSLVLALTHRPVDLSGTKPEDVRPATGKQGFLAGVALAADGRLAGAFEGRVATWDVQAVPPILLSARSLPKTVYRVAFDRPGERLAGALEDGTVEVWDPRRGRSFQLKGHTAALRALAFHPDGKQLASGGADRTVKLWDLQTEKQAFALSGHRGAVTGTAYGPDGKRLASASQDGSVRLWDTATGTLLVALWGHGAAVSGVAYAPGGRQLAVAFQDGILQLWNVPGLPEERR